MLCLSGFELYSRWVPLTKGPVKYTEVGRLTVTNPCAMKSVLCKNYRNIINKNITFLAGSCKIEL